MNTNNFLNKTALWWNCSRAYSLPITVLNWVVIFIYSIKHHGAAFNGILALLGICFAHLAANMTDDYLDYKILIKDKRFLNSAQNCKCAYLKNGQATPVQWRIAIILMLAVAGVIGAVLIFLSGKSVILLAFCGLFVVLFYQYFSLRGLGEIVVIVAFGPLMYEGVYYVMTKTFSSEVFLLSFACAFMTNTVLYTHMLMDFDGDECSHKTTLCRKFKTKTNALRFIVVFYLASFILIAALAVLSKNYLYFLTWITIPLIVDLYKSLISYNNDKTNLPEIRIWHYPLDNWKRIKQTKDASFFFRFFYSRNIVTVFMLLVCLAVLFNNNV